MQPRYEEYLLENDGRTLNNPRLPLLVYPGALEGEDLRQRFMRELEKNGWGGAWVGGAFSYHHYHSTAHEALRAVGGEARLTFGGESGIELDLSAGDPVVIPAGVGHCNSGSSSGFAVIGAYPDGQSWDLLIEEDPGELPRALENIRSVPLPQADPVFGADGPAVTWVTCRRG